MTNYPRHVFKPEVKKGERADWQLGPGWTKDGNNYPYGDDIPGDDKMEMINDDYASKNLWER